MAKRAQYFIKKHIGAIISFVFIALVFVCSLSLDIHVNKLFAGFSNLGILFDDAFPPDISILGLAAQAIFETIQIAYLGTFWGTLMAFPLGFLAARNLFSTKVTVPTRLFIAMIRTLPALLWAVVFVIMVGFGSLAGVLAMSVYTVGYISKWQYETIEGINPEPLEALHGIGTSKVQIIRYVVIPEAANQFLSQILFMFDYNVRFSSILGFVGAGGIGFYISGYLKLLQYDKVMTLLIILFVTIVIIDYMSLKIRDRYLLK
jgi:phosphonate transport system permease protein